MHSFDFIVIGAGLSGCVIAERIANNLDKKVLIIEKRSHIGGNAYDYYDPKGILCHKYGPHLFHTNLKHVLEYLSSFGDWRFYEHRVLGKLENIYVPLPFNLQSIELCFEEQKASKIKELLIEKYKMGSKIGILELKKHTDPIINELADYVYNNVFLGYTIKQWGLRPEEINPLITNRVPIHISYDDRYFQDAYQFMPREGFTPIFEKMLNNKNITIKLNTSAQDLLKLDAASNQMYFEDKPYNLPMIYTGALDELLECRFGELPYRSLEFEFETFSIEQFQPVGTVNYPSEEFNYTRISEFKHFTGQTDISDTTIIREYPMPYKRNAESGNIPYYPIITEESQKKYKQYQDFIGKYDNLYCIGRLAEFRYYNMDSVIDNALNLFHINENRWMEI